MTDRATLPLQRAVRRRVGWALGRPLVPTGPDPVGSGHPVAPAAVPLRSGPSVDRFIEQFDARSVA